MRSVTLGLGSNLGDRLATLQRAVDLLADAQVRVVASSRVWETDPIGPAQPDFLNAVVAAETDLEPLDVLVACQRVEESLGRVRRERWGPRTIDIDILLVDGVAIDEPDLLVPHPRMTERAFVMLPLLELDPDPVLPDGRRMKDIRLTSFAAARPFAPPLRLSSA